MRNDIETVVFDLDGTIYQNTVFHHVLSALFGRGHLLRMLAAEAGGIYRAGICRQAAAYEQLLHPEEAELPILEAFFSALEQCLCPPLTYRQALETQGLLYLGDAWAVVILIGKALGLLEGGTE